MKEMKKIIEKINEDEYFKERIETIGRAFEAVGISVKDADNKFKALWVLLEELSGRLEEFVGEEDDENR